MILDLRQRAQRPKDSDRLRSAARSRRRAITPGLEYLEGRRLLSFFTGPSANRPVFSAGGIFRIQVEGTGVVKVHPAAKGAIDLTAFGTSADSTITITQIRPRFHFASRYLSIHNLTITSGQLGSLVAPQVALTGTMTRVNNTLTDLTLGALGSAARLDVNGSVGDMTVAQIDLGPTGHVLISGALNTADLTGTMTIGGMTIDGGQFEVGTDSLAPILVTGNMNISHDGVFGVGRDLDGSLTVNGNLELDTGGQIAVGRNLSELNVMGNLIVNPSGSGIVAGGAVGGVTIDGFFQGQGGTAAPKFFDLGVGLNLSGLTILGANAALNGLINANIRAGGTISGVDIVYGSVNSTIQPNTPPPPA
jgi:hypothetical protein